jgi:hypothetical protein
MKLTEEQAIKMGNLTTIAVLLLLQGLGWGLFLTRTLPFSPGPHWNESGWPHRLGSGWEVVVGTIVYGIIVLLGGIAILFVGLEDENPFTGVIAVVATASLVLLVYANIDYLFGTARNFSQALSPLDALYVAVGVLTTVGTGNIIAVSETSRLLLTLEMVLDILLVLIGGAFYLGIIQDRFNSKSSRTYEYLQTKLHR